MSGDCFDFVEVAAACDLIPKNWYEKQWLMEEPLVNSFPDAVFYEDYDKMPDEAKLDVIIVETGADIHAEFCRRALCKNINVMTDIPVVATLKEADELWKAAQKSTALISVGANPNEQKFVEMLKDYYKSGKLGKPYYMEAEYIHWFEPGGEAYFHLIENGAWRNSLSDIRYCTHSLGPLLTVVPDELRYVSCFGTGQHSENVHENEKLKTDDMMAALFRTNDGTTIRLLRNGRCRARIEGHNYRVFGTEGYMERMAYGCGAESYIRYNSTLDNDEKMHSVSGEFTPIAFKDDPNLKRGNTHDGLDYAMFYHFYDALLNNKPAPISLKEGLKMTLPGIYAEESAKRGGELMKMYYPWDDEWKTEL